VTFKFKDIPIIKPINIEGFFEGKKYFYRGESDINTIEKRGKAMIAFECEELFYGYWNEEEEKIRILIGKEGFINYEAKTDKGNQSADCQYFPAKKFDSGEYDLEEYVYRLKTIALLVAKEHSN
jgi:hypothetical protein